ncbi:cathelicidin-2-like [Chiloscyllium plagiosum]|uniref:cathelicidin-2-like n=1 Tax=Chiloscyllium plagiosum TaxID=36176 RepID=UPI001CB85628|nr:cathelicidin-2-like [Chiloscyllium plagiosum]
MHQRKMKSLQRIILFVGFFTVTANVAVPALTSEDVASAAVTNYNKRHRPANAFKLFRILKEKEQNLNEATIHFIHLQMRETTCSTDTGIVELDDCHFKDNGVIMKCNTRVVVSRRAPRRPRVLAINCTVVSPQERFSPDEWAVLARVSSQT